MGTEWINKYGAGNSPFGLDIKYTEYRDDEFDETSIDDWKEKSKKITDYIYGSVKPFFEQQLREMIEGEPKYETNREIDVDEYPGFDRKVTIEFYHPDTTLGYRVVMKCEEVGKMMECEIIENWYNPDRYSYDRDLSGVAPKGSYIDVFEKGIVIKIPL